MKTPETNILTNKSHGRSESIGSTTTPSGSQSTQAIETGRTRILMVLCIAISAFAAICVRLVDLAIFQRAEEPNTTRVAQKTGLTTQRADIIDRNGVLLATNLTTASLYANPSEVINANQVATELASLLPNLDSREIEKKLKSNKRFLWIQRKLTPRQQWQVNRLGHPGLDFLHEEARVYPKGNLISHVLGYTDRDNHGIAGMEKSLDKVLQTSHDPVQVSLDVRLQHIMYTELSRSISEFSAVGGAGIVLDTRNSEVLALVSLPDFNPHHPGDAAAEQLFNRATLGVYEVGSTFKIFTTAIALETGVVDLSGGYDATHPIRISRHTISDFHPKKRWLSVPEIFQYSSNIGAAKMASNFGTKAQRSFLTQLGLTKILPMELVESGKPLTPRHWRRINTMTIGYGHGIAISALHLAAGAAATINGGIYNSPTFLTQSHSTTNTRRTGLRVFSKETSLQMRKLMRLAVKEGTGRQSAAPGYLVGGKTGTADTASGGKYSGNSRLSSFLGAFPMNDPRYIVLVLLQNPKGNTKTHGHATGGWTAAPAVSRVVQRMAPFVAITPIDENLPEIKRQLHINVIPKRPRLASY